MSGDVTKLLNAVSQGAAAEGNLMRAVYDELRQLARQKLTHEKPGNTLDATALVHDVYLRLGTAGQTWQNRRHFFAAAAEAMRRILVESARRKHAAESGRAHSSPPPAASPVSRSPRPETGSPQATIKA